MVRPMVHSTKHYVQEAQFTVAGGAIGVRPIATAVAVVDKNNREEIEEGSSIKAVFVEMWITANASTTGTSTINLEKRMGGQVAQTFAQAILLDAYPNKKNVLYATQGLIPRNTQNPVAIIRQWFKIPKSKQRFGLGDELILNFASITNGLVVCGFSTYKEYQ